MCARGPRAARPCGSRTRSPRLSISPRSPRGKVIDLTPPEPDADEGHRLPAVERGAAERQPISRARTPATLRLARNEIFARKGRIFNDPALAAHFEKFDWYKAHDLRADAQRRSRRRTSRSSASTRCRIRRPRRASCSPIPTAGCSPRTSSRRSTRRSCAMPATRSMRGAAASSCDQGSAGLFQAVRLVPATIRRS